MGLKRVTSRDQRNVVTTRRGYGPGQDLVEDPNVGALTLANQSPQLFGCRIAMRRFHKQQCVTPFPKRLPKSTDKSQGILSFQEAMEIEKEGIVLASKHLFQLFTFKLKINR